MSTERSKPRPWLRDRFPCARLTWPEAFEQPDFLAYLNRDGTATWHTRGEPADDFSDVFFWYDGGEGSDSLAMPDWAWEGISNALGPDFHGIVWIVNLKD